MATVIKGYEVSDLRIQRSIDATGIHYGISIVGDSDYIALLLMDYTDLLKYLAVIDFNTHQISFGSHVFEFVDFDTELLIFVLKKV